MRQLAVLVLVCIAACAGDADYAGQDPDAGTGADGNTCGSVITFDPDPAYADPVAPIRARANVVSAGGVLTYDWTVRMGGTTITHTTEASDNSQIGFIAATAGVYTVDVIITGALLTGCNYASATINVLAPGANVDVYRLRTVPPTGKAPPQETIIQVRGGGDVDRAIALEEGGDYSLAVQQTGTGAGVPAYVKFMPVSAPNAFTELFTQSNGTFTTKLLGQMHDVLVIPTSTALAPKRVTWSPTSGTALVVGPGTVVTGTVRDPANNGLAGAKVQLSSGGVPSTLATTAGDGTFSLRADFGAGAMVTVKVTPPAASGLPRLEATGQFNLATAMQIAYSASLATCDLSNTPVRRNAANQAGVKVTVVGSLAAVAGTVTAGAAANALGTVRVAASTDGAGRLPTMLVPRAPLSAVVELGMNDFAVDAIDTSTCPSLTIDAPALIVRTGTARNASQIALSGVRVEASPRDALALAGAQTITVATNSSGAFSLPLASGGTYDVRFVDPFARAARLLVENVAPAGVPTTATLPKALAISGKVSIIGSANPVVGASVQLLCATCTGLDATRPVAETATNGLSEYRLAVPDPGTM